MTAPLAFEPTAIGEQGLVQGVAPITPRDRLAILAAAPLAPAKTQRHADFGLFDLAARDQLDLFAALRMCAAGAAPELPPRGG